MTKYRIKEVVDSWDNTTCFVPQVKRFFVWWTYKTGLSEYYDLSFSTREEAVEWLVKQHNHHITTVYHDVDLPLSNGLTV